MLLAPCRLNRFPSECYNVSGCRLEAQKSCVESPFDVHDICSAIRSLIYIGTNDSASSPTKWDASRLNMMPNFRLDRMPLLEIEEMKTRDTLFSPCRTRLVDLYQRVPRLHTSSSNKTLHRHLSESRRQQRYSRRPMFVD